MREDADVAEMVEITSSGAPLPDRARDVVHALGRWLPFEAAWLAMTDPGSAVYPGVSSTGLDRAVLERLDGPGTAREIRLNGLDRDRPPVSAAELPVPLDRLPTWTECLRPAGFRGGLAVPLFEPDGSHVGILGLLTTSGQAPSAESRDRLARVSPVIARGLSPLRSLLATARIVRGATAGIVLLRDGTTYVLPGLGGHALLEQGSPVLQIARRALLAGQVFRSFMWPDDDGSLATDHVRMTVLGATDLPAFVLGTLLLAPDADCQGLTPRELQVLGLLVDGRSNQQIARQLAVAPRTVAAHVEHVLGKLQAPTRTSAAVRAEREGCYVPPAPTRIRRSGPPISAALVTR